MHIRRKRKITPDLNARPADMREWETVTFDKVRPGDTVKTPSWSGIVKGVDTTDNPVFWIDTGQPGKFDMVQADEYATVKRVVDLQSRAVKTVIDTLSDHCYACDTHIVEGHSHDCPVLAAFAVGQQMANAGPSQYAVDALPSIGNIGKTYFRRTDGTLWTYTSDGYKPAGTI